MIIVAVLFILVELFAGYALIRISQHAEPDWRIAGGLVGIMIVSAFVAGSLGEKLL